MTQINYAERVTRPAEGLRAENARLRRMLAKAQIDAALNAVMLGEGDHRIKNSLQIVVSLLRLQPRSAESPDVSDALLSAAARIQSVARVHDALGRAGETGTVELGGLFETMCESLAVVLEGTGVRIEAHLERAETSATSARSVMLAANELLINAVRHAYPGGRAGVIRVSLRRQGEDLHIAVADDGAGLPPDKLGSAGGFGLKLVRMMTQQLGGALWIDSDCGARFSIVIPARSPSLGKAMRN